MSIDFKLLTQHNKAYSGDIDAICHMIKHFYDKEEKVLAAEYLILLVDNKPELCERRLKENTGLTMDYESMLAYIGGAYYNNGYIELSYRWLQKYLDYTDFANTHREPEIWKEYRKTAGAYEILKEADELDKIHNRFLLKWEQDLFYKQGARWTVYSPKLPEQYS